MLNFAIACSRVSFNLENGGKLFDAAYNNAGLITPQFMISKLVTELQGKIKSLNANNPSMLFYCGILGIDSGHGQYGQIQLLPDGSYSISFFNTGLGSFHYHSSKVIDEKIHVYPLIITGLRLEAITDSEFLAWMISKQIYKQEQVTVLFQQFYQDIQTFLIDKWGGTKLSYAGKAYPSQIKGSCAYSGLIKALAQQLSEQDLKELKKITAVDLLKQFSQFKANVFPTLSSIQQSELAPSIAIAEDLRSTFAATYQIEVM